MNLPPSWNRMTPRNQRFYLIDTHQAKDFADACAKLARPRTPKPRPTTRRGKAVNVVEGAWYNSGTMA